MAREVKSDIVTHSAGLPAGRMMQATQPDSERARLDALHGYAVLDTGPESDFDGLTRLAAQICATPAAIVAFVDLDRVWFKSRLGLGRAEVPRAGGFCEQTILQADPLVVGDATTGPPVRGPPSGGRPRGYPLLRRGAPAGRGGRRPGHARGARSRAAQPVAATGRCASHPLAAGHRAPRVAARIQPRPRPPRRRCAPAKSSRPASSTRAPTASRCSISTAACCR